MRFNGSSRGDPTEPHSVAETLRQVNGQNVRLENHSGRLVIASSVDDRLRDSIQRHSATLLALAVVVEPEPVKPDVVRPEAIAAPAASLASPHEQSSVMQQLVSNREHWLGIQEVADIALGLSASETAEFKDRVERADSKVTRWAIVREMFSTGFKLPGEGNGF